MIKGLQKLTMTGLTKWRITIIIIILFPASVFSQDRIYTTFNTTIEAKIEEIGTIEIKYRKFSNLSGPIYVIEKKDVRMIEYENGEKEVFEKVEEIKQVSYSKPAYRAGSGLNQDAIAEKNGDTLECTIQSVNKGYINYVIKKFGPDTKSKISLTKVSGYYFRQQWFYPEGLSSDVDKPRSLVLVEKFNDAIGGYSQLIAKDSVNAALLAEEAYVLALAGAYDAALLRLDQSKNLAHSPFLFYYASQVFELMGYEDIAHELLMVNDVKPLWCGEIVSRFKIKYKSNPGSIRKFNKSELVAAFKNANMLAARYEYFQSIALFHRITDEFPGEYLPFFGYSIALENAGLLNKAVSVIEKALISAADNYDKKEFLNERLSSLRQKALKKKSPNAPAGQMMAYAGLLAGNNFLSINGKLGYFVAGSTNASFDLNVSNNSGLTGYNMGLSVYTRTGILVSGAGFGMYLANSRTDFTCHISVGLSIPNAKKTSSLDIFLDVNAGLTKGSITTYGLSFGKTIYFGKRK